MFKVDHPQDNGSKKSTFLLTVNTSDTPSEASKLKLKNIMDNILTNFDKYLMAKNRNDINISENIRDCKCQSVIEVGKKFHRVHSHSLIKFNSSDEITWMVNLPRLRDELEEILGFTPFVRVKFCKDHNKDITNYILKDQE